MGSATRLRYIGHWQVRGFGPWTVRESATGRFIGEIGFFDYRRDTVPDFAGIPEVGWVTAQWAHGRGFASEALAAMFAWGDRRPGFERTVAMITAENEPSVRLAQRFGYRPVLDVNYKGHTNLLFERVVK
jgi:RimJ/RimL family protein N-acetyltransferase